MLKVLFTEFTKILPTVDNIVTVHYKPFFHTLNARLHPALTYDLVQQNGTCRRSNDHRASQITFVIILTVHIRTGNPKTKFFQFFNRLRNITNLNYWDIFNSTGRNFRYHSI